MLLKYFSNFSELFLASCHLESFSSSTVKSDIFSCGLRNRVAKENDAGRIWFCSLPSSQPSLPVWTFNPGNLLFYLLRWQRKVKWLIIVIIIIIIGCRRGRVSPDKPVTLDTVHILVLSFFKSKLRGCSMSKFSSHSSKILSLDFRWLDFSNNFLGWREAREEIPRSMGYNYLRYMWRTCTFISNLLNYSFNLENKIIYICLFMFAFCS